MTRSSPFLLIACALVSSQLSIACLPGAAPPAATGQALRPGGGGDGLWQDSAIFEAVTALMGSGGERIWVEMYEFDRADLADRMLAARAGGADVRLVYDPSVTVSRATAARLRSRGVDARPYPLDDRRHQIDHVKLLLTESAALVGGMNWGSRSAANHDYAVETHSPAALERLRQTFMHDWGLASGAPSPPPSAERAPALPDLAVFETVPGDGIRQALSRAVAAARSRIQAEVFALTDPDVIAGLADAARRGLTVRVLLDPNQDVNRPTFDLLHRGGVAVRWYPVPRGAKLHAKAGLFDDRLLLGSANWSRSGLGVNHELDLLLDQPAAVSAFARRFAADWALAA